MIETTTDKDGFAVHPSLGSSTAERCDNSRHRLLLYFRQPACEGWRSVRFSITERLRPWLARGELAWATGERTWRLALMSGRPGNGRPGRCSKLGSRKALTTTRGSARRLQLRQCCVYIYMAEKTTQVTTTL